MTDQIVLKGVSARGHHGVLDFEKRDGQVFVVDVTMDVDLAPAGSSDDLADTVSYAEVAGDVVALIEGEPLDLIEALAARIADKVLTRPRSRRSRSWSTSPRPRSGTPSPTSRCG